MLFGSDCNQIRVVGFNVPQFTQTSFLQKKSNVAKCFFDICNTEQMAQCTDVRFASLLSGGFTTMAVIDPPEKKLAKRTSLLFTPIVKSK